MRELSEVGKGIKTASRDIRAARGLVRPASRPVPASRANEFGLAILHRYQGRLGSLPQFEWILLHLRPNLATRFTTKLTQIQLAPRLTLAIPGFPPPRPEDKGLKLQNKPPGQVETRLINQTINRTAVTNLREHLVQQLMFRQPALPPQTTMQREHLVQHLITHRKRVEVVELPGGAMGTASRVNKPIQPAPPVVRRSAPLIDAVQELPANGKFAVQKSSQPIATEPVDVNRLTDQVIQAIDRRIIAQRERMGRI